MRSFLLIGLSAALLAIAPAPPAVAKGCIKGAVVGGVAGHYAGRHGIIGALGGCVVGRRLAKNHAARQREERLQQQQATSSYTGGAYTRPSTGTGYRGGGYQRPAGTPAYAPAQAASPSGVNGGVYNGGAYQR